jgi:beta-glucosidase
VARLTLKLLYRAEASVADYAAILGKRLGDRVGDWMTLNEPTSIAWGGYINGGSAPDRHDRRTGFAAAHNLNRAHAEAVRALRASCPGKTRVGVALNSLAIRPATDAAADARAAARLDAKRNRLFMDPMLRGEYPRIVIETMPELPEWIRPGDMAGMAPPLDFVGVNYYHNFAVRSVPAGQAGTSDIGNVAEYGYRPEGESATELGDPDGLRQVLLRYHREYGVREMIVTENGRNRPEDSPVDGRVDDAPRTAYLRDHLTAARHAIEDGCNLTGYCVWSLTDNFEWASGTGPRMGLIHVDYGTQRRTIKDSGRWYASCARANAVV